MLYLNRYNSSGNKSLASLLINKVGKHTGIGNRDNDGSLTFGATDVQGNWLDEYDKYKFCGQIISTQPNGTAPLSVTSTTKVDNLNADMVDGLHSSDFVRNYKVKRGSIDDILEQSFVTYDPVPDGNTPVQSPNISVLTIGNVENRTKQLAFPYDTDSIYYRRIHGESGNPVFGDWKQLAFTDSVEELKSEIEALKDEIASLKEQLS